MIHAAKIEHSPRLQRVLAFLLERGSTGATTWEIMRSCRTCTPCVNELRANGIRIDTA